MAGPLVGLRVIEAGEGAAAAFAAKLLADLGADVVKIEDPEQGDVSRTRGPFPGNTPHPEKSGTFLYLNTNKRGVTIDLTHPRGREALTRLAGEADLLIHNVHPTRMAEQGLIYSDLHRRHPRLVMTSISPFGQTGPHREYKASELVSTNAGGWAWLIDPDGGGAEYPPLKAFGQQCQFQAGLNAGVASMGALLARERHGEQGQHIDVSVQECVMTFLEMNFIHYTYGGRVASRLGTRILQPWSIMPAKDGLVFLLTVEEDQWTRFVEWMGSPEWASWEVFADRFARRDNWDVLKPMLEEWTSQYTVEEIYKGGLERRLAFAPVSTMGDLLNSDQLRVRGFFAEMTHPAAGTLEIPAAPVQFRQTPWELRAPAPLHGEHTDEVLMGIGYGAGEIQKLRDEGVI
jgi:crotonobetainyl-CoA:carnitine CoA-transferase CaiB-like acyl-CoA transferase